MTACILDEPQSRPLAGDGAAPVVPVALARPLKARVIDAVRVVRTDRLSTTALALMATTATTSVLGLAFWTLASRSYPASQVGEDAALISALMLLSIASQLNLGMGLARFLPQVGRERWRPVLGAYGLSTAVGAVAATAFVVVAPQVSAGFAFLGGQPALAFGLVAGVVAWNVFALQDAALTSARWAKALPIENGAFGLLKIGLMVALAGSVAGHGIFVAWLVAMFVLIVPVNGLLFGKVLPQGNRAAGSAAVDSAAVDSAAAASAASAVPLTSRPKVARYLAVDYVAALLSQGYNGLLPLLVLGVLGRAANAYFYAAFLIAAAVGTLGHNLTTSLVVEGAHDESQLAVLARRSVRRYAAFVLPVVVVLVIGAPVALAPFGAEYAEQGTTVLRLLLLGTVPQAIVGLYLGVERIRARVSRVVGLEAATMAVITVGSLAAMPTFGLVGVGAAWLAGHSLVALVAGRRLRSVAA